MPLPQKAIGYKRAFFALCLSILVHYLVFMSADYHLPNQAQQIDLEIILDQPIVTEKQDVKATHNQPRKSKQQKSEKNHPQHTKPSAPVEASEYAPAMSDNQNINNAVQDTPPPTASDEVTEQNTDSAADSSTQATLTLEDIQKTPAQIDLIFEVKRNDTKIGVAEVHFKRLGDFSYQLTSERRATGIAAAFIKAKDLEISQGHIGETGIKPDNFTHQFGREGKKLHQAIFNWAAAKLVLQNNDEHVEIDLPQGTQDMLSFMYQFMFVAPLTQMQMNITNGRKLNQYTYGFEGETTIDTPSGPINTLHIAKNSGEGEEKFELWLAINQHYLPVKIRKTDKDGVVFEQTLSEIESK